MIALFRRWVFSLTNHDKAINCWPSTNAMRWAMSLWGRGLTHLGSETAWRKIGLWFWHILPSSAKLDLTRCKEMAEKPRACQLPLPGEGRDNWEQLVGSQEQEKHQKAHLPAYRLVISNANDRLAMWWEGLGTHCMKFSSYHTSLILSLKPI